MQESGEMYLETILRLSKEQPMVRAIDVSEYMNFSKPSVSRAMGILKKDGFITVDSGTGAITLTEAGRARASKIFERHQVLTQILEYIGVSPEAAEEDACKVEHYISDETFAAIHRCAETVIKDADR